MKKAGNKNSWKIAIIGSFRQHYDAVLSAWEIFTSKGHEVTSPHGKPILKDGIPFVRFSSDPEDLDDFAVQSIALHRILRADFVYVVVPKGYIGKTTCYEVGRIIQAKQPIFFSEKPEDLPLRVDSSRIIQ